MVQEPHALMTYVQYSKRHVESLFMYDYRNLIPALYVNAEVNHTLNMYITQKPHYNTLPSFHNTFNERIIRSLRAISVLLYS